MSTKKFINGLKGLMNILNRHNIDMDDLLVLTDIDNLVNDFEKTIPEINHIWDFVQAYYPDYTRCDEIAENDDLYVILDDEMEEGSGAYDTYLEILQTLAEERNVSSEEITHEQIIQRVEQMIAESNAYI